jgi:hypothetical protein
MILPGLPLSKNIIWGYARVKKIVNDLLDKE